MIMNEALPQLKYYSCKDMGRRVTPCDEFFEAADKYGLLVWSDFWVTGDTQGEFKGSPDWPLEGEVFKKNVENTILRIRNHPSLLLWTGGNEGHARKELYDFMRTSVIKLDGTRPFIPSSSGLRSCPKDGTVHGPTISPEGFTVAVHIPGRIQENIIKRLLKQKTGSLRMKQAYPHSLLITSCTKLYRI
jgi:hypothetical protein